MQDDKKCPARNKECLNFGGVDSGASCNVIDRQLWESLKQNKVKCVSLSHKKQQYPYGSKEPLKRLVVSRPK
ncbi:unnamed protein product [Porites lobata]|uniref:Uncharacterized protein n=1 Tax=Porites lobata TaxID=104759 RepID=A0ABN8P801_9CNID|nr:unnamed protein product [Porites lobata]